jgi:hypothetical protein
MGNKIKSVALALAGLGLFTAGAVGKDNARSVHEQMRTRILARVGSEQIAREELRAALRSDPDFDRLLAYHRQRLLQGRTAPDLAEEAVQATFYKMWKGSPEIFLREHEVVERYMSVAMKHNLASELKRAAARPHEQASDHLDDRRLETRSDPSEAIAAQELWDRLAARCTPTDQQVLGQQIGGTRSAREIAKETGLTRFAARSSSKRIAEKLEYLRSRS